MNPLLRRFSAPKTGNETTATSNFGTTLALWMVLTVALEGVLWATGFKHRDLAEAVEQGAAQIERRAIGEENEEVIREAIQTQRDTLPFWTALVMIGDFVIEPLALALRAAVFATAFSALAALVGRPARFDTTLAECVRLQGIWVLGLAIQVVLMVTLREPQVETSVVLVLSPGTHSAPVWVALRQVSLFAVLGWAALAWMGWRRGQTNLPAAFSVSALLALVEVILRTNMALVIQAGTRLTLLPE